MRKDSIYTPENTKAAYQLNWGLTIFWQNSAVAEEHWISELQQSVEPDGVRILKHRFPSKRSSQFFISTKPHVTPSAILRSVKGRLQHHLSRNIPKAFQRNYFLRSIGSATREVVENYVSNQLGHHRMADVRVQELLSKYQLRNVTTDLAKPSFSAHGQYIYNLHFVVVNESRWMETDERRLDKLSKSVTDTASRNRHRLSRVSLLADHIHTLVGCPIDQSPEEIVLRYMNDYACALGCMPAFQFGYYVGTVGEYTRNAV